MVGDRDTSLVNKPFPLILIGLRAAGKSTLGRDLADHLHVSFEDLDDLALARTGAESVEAVFEISGEVAWRNAERDAFLAWLDAPSAILACGGGAPCVPQIETALQSCHACIVYLHASVDALVARRKGEDDARPALFDAGGVDKEVTQAYEERDSRYRALAQYVLEVGSQEPQDSLHALRQIVEK